jgi:hypothetical protein
MSMNGSGRLPHLVGEKLRKIAYGVIPPGQEPDLEAFRSISRIAYWEARKGLCEWTDVSTFLQDFGVSRDLPERFGEEIFNETIADAAEEVERDALDEQDELDQRAILADQQSNPPATGWRANAIKASDLRNKVFAPVKCVLPGLVTDGFNLFAGKPKIGKSWLLLDACIAIAANRFTLGQIKPETGDVLYLALEDSQRRLLKRIDKLLTPFSAEWPARLTFATEWKKTNNGGLDDIAEWCRSVKTPKLVVIDTLELIRPPQTSKGQSYSADYEAIRVLQKFSHAMGVAIVASHHLRKMEADDPFDTISGTLGLTGAADTILVIKKQAGAVTLYAHGRDIEESESALQFDRGTCRWTILGSAAEVSRSNERSRVIAALKETGTAMSPSELQVAAELKTRNSADVLLFRMARDGEIERAERGRYQLPADPDSKVDSKIARKIKSDAQAIDIAPDHEGLNGHLTDLTDLTDTPHHPRAGDGLDIPECFRRTRQ